MAETLRELVVALSLDSSNFSRNMRTINQQIKEAESTFRLAGGEAIMICLPTCDYMPYHRVNKSTGCV